MFNSRKCYEYRKSNLLKRVEKPEEMPKGEHFVILGMYTSSYTIPGDERSRTNPGHGYPESTVTNNMIEYWVCANETVWQELITEFYEEQTKKTYYSNKEYIVPIKVAGVATVETKVVVKVK